MTAPATSPFRLRPEPPAAHIALMVTRRCNMACAHCSVESGPQVVGEPGEGELLDHVRAAAAAGVRSIRFTGGEPMLRARLVVRLVRECRRLGLGAAVTTNGFWGVRPESARRHLRALWRAGLGSLTVSYDRYHADFQGPGPIGHILHAAQALDFPVSINVVRSGEGDQELAEIVAGFEGSPSARFRFYDVQPVGRADRLPTGSFRGDVGGFCSACDAPAITDDGRVIACNGPSYFAGPLSPLNVGSLRDRPLSALLARHREDPILDTIRTFGPVRLRDELLRIPGFESFPSRARYLGICQLCHQITGNPRAVEALRPPLSAPRLVAERAAARRVIEAARRDGPFSYAHVNGAGTARVFLRAAWEGGPLAPEAARILSRPDLDWRRLGDYLAACGLTRLLHEALADPALTAWAPAFFIDRMRSQAVRDGLRDMVQREAVREVAAVLGELGGRGTLLKGTAVQSRASLDGRRGSVRATGDVDVYVEPRLALPLRQRLLARGFAGDPDPRSQSAPHLAPVSFQGVPVEIHTHLMARFWGLPEREMLDGARPLPDGGPLGTLGVEGFLLHAGMHTSQHFFSHGLKTAWDLLWALETSPATDWDRLARWVRASRVPRGFWVPVSVLARDLGIPLPEAFLREAPRDAVQRRLETVARARLFRTAETLMDLNVFSKTALILLLHDSWQGRARYVAGEVAARGLHRRHWDAIARRPGGASPLRQAWGHWRRYRRAMARVETAPES